MRAPHYFLSSLDHPLRNIPQYDSQLTKTRRRLELLLEDLPCEMDPLEYYETSNQLLEPLLLCYESLVRRNLSKNDSYDSYPEAYLITPAGDHPLFAAILWVWSPCRWPPCRFDS